MVEILGMKNQTALVFRARGWYLTTQQNTNEMMEKFNKVHHQMDESFFYSHTNPFINVHQYLYQLE